MTKGYEISFVDFVRLLSDAEWRKSIAPLLTRWFGCSVEMEGGELRVIDSAGGEMNLWTLHEAIQGSPAYQYRLYQEAMNLWR